MASEVIPSLDEAIGELCRIRGNSRIGPTTLLSEADVDSLDLLDWVYSLGFEEDSLDTETLSDLLEGATVGEFYDLLLAAQSP